MMNDNILQNKNKRIKVRKKHQQRVNTRKKNFSSLFFLACLYIFRHRNEKTNKRQLTNVK